MAKLIALALGLLMVNILLVSGNPKKPSFCEYHIKFCWYYGGRCCFCSCCCCCCCYIYYYYYYFNKILRTFESIIVIIRTATCRCRSLSLFTTQTKRFFSIHVSTHAWPFSIQLTKAKHESKHVLRRSALFVLWKVRGSDSCTLQFLLLLLLLLRVTQK